MSEHDVERHRRIYQALNARDADALVALFDPNVEIHSVFSAVGGAIYHGHDGYESGKRTSKSPGEANFVSR